MSKQTRQTKMIRPSLDSSSVSLILNFTERFLADTALIIGDANIVEQRKIAKHINYVFRKEELKLNSGVGVAYVKVAPEDRVRMVVSVETLGGSDELSDSEKLAAMSSEEVAAFWAEQEAVLLGSINNASN